MHTKMISQRLEATSFPELRHPGFHLKLVSAAIGRPDIIVPYKSWT